MEDLSQDFQDLIELFVSHHVDFLVVGVLGKRLSVLKNSQSRSAISGNLLNTVRILA